MRLGFWVFVDFLFFVVFFFFLSRLSKNRTRSESVDGVIIFHRLQVVGAHGVRASRQS